MFLGVSTINVDAKGRLAVPAKYRERLAGTAAGRVVLTINPLERCLWLYPELEWQEIARKVARLPSLKSQNRTLQRLLLGHASELEMDAQGRLLVSAELRRYAGIGKKAALVGQGQKFEVWDESQWLEQREQWLEEAALPDSELSGELENLAL